MCLSVCLFVTALAASACVHSSHKRYTRVSRRLFLDFDSWIFENASVPEIWPKRANFLSSPAAVLAQFRDQPGAGPTSPTTFQ